MKYVEDLAYQPVVSTRVVNLITELNEGTLTNKQLHSRKDYCKRTKNLTHLLELTVAFEIHNFIRRLS